MKTNENPPQNKPIVSACLPARPVTDKQGVDGDNVETQTHRPDFQSLFKTMDPVVKRAVLRSTIMRVILL